MALQTPLRLADGNNVRPSGSLAWLAYPVVVVRGEQLVVVQRRVDMSRRRTGHT